MCIAVLARPGAKLTNATLFKGWTVNSHGGGFAYVNKEGKLILDKGHMKFNEFQKAYERILEHEVADDSPMLIHMRITSQGDTTPANTHPFLVGPDEGVRGAMIHNGTLFRPSGVWEGKVGEKNSDTKVMATALRTILTAEAIQNSVAELGQAIGSHNKLCFLFDDKSWAIINESSGYWADDVWYSNGSCGVDRPKVGK